jgi:uncharacterized protein (TIGR00251 family)
MPSATELYEVEGDDAVVLAVHATPGAGRTQVVGRHGDALKIRVAVPPERGRANAALAEVLAEAFGVAASSVELVAGDTSRSKRFRLSGLDLEDFADRLEQVLDGYPAAPSRRTPRTR